MPIDLTCACGKRLRIKDAHAGKRARCPACNHPLQIPAVEGAPTTAAPAGVQTTPPAPAGDTRAPAETPRRVAQPAPRGSVGRRAPRKVWPVVVGSAAVV